MNAAPRRQFIRLWQKHASRTSSTTVAVNIHGTRFHFLCSSENLAEEMQWWFSFFTDRGENPPHHLVAVVAVSGAECMDALQQFGVAEIPNNGRISTKLIGPIFISFFLDRLLIVSLPEQGKTLACIQPQITDHLFHALFPHLCRILSRRHLFALHAAAVSDEYGATAIVGSPGAGKSTTALHLADLGWSVMSDDRCFIRVRHKKVDALAFPRPICIAPDIVDRIPHSFNNIRQFGRRAVLDYRLVGEQPIPTTNRLRNVIFLTGDGSEHFQPIVLPAHRATTRMLQINTPYYLDHELPELFRIITAVCCSCKCFSVGRIWPPDHFAEAIDDFLKVLC